MKMALSVLFDGTFEGLLTIVHSYYYDKITPDFIELEYQYQRRLDTEYVEIYTNPEKSDKVLNGILKKISVDKAQKIYMAYLNAAEDRFINIFRYIVLGFKVGARVDEYQTVEYVKNVLEYSQYVSGEAHKQKGFLRFHETRNGFYFAQIAPVNNILHLMADFFADRFPDMQFAIMDERRKTVCIYDTKEIIIREIDGEAKVNFSENEMEFQRLWYTFYKSIANHERANSKLQTNLLPKRYRKYMTEFKYELEEYNSENSQFSLIKYRPKAE